MELIKVNFKDCSREYLEETFFIEQVRQHNILDNWLIKKETYSLNELETMMISRLQAKLCYRVDDWNELELIEYFIAPLFALIDFSADDYSMFANREMQAVIDNIKLTGTPDAIIAKGRRSPKIPYFCFNEYKREEESKGEPIGQCLAAMLVAQALNNNEKPIYGVVVKGEKWQFIVLQNKEYAISKSYRATDEELYEIVKLLKHMKTIIEEFVKM
jgi:hypothetical protein